MSKSYQQLTAIQRSQINVLKSIHFSNRRIAKERAVLHTTINNELIPIQRLNDVRWRLGTSHTNS